MTNLILIKRILTLISQTYALPLIELENIYNHVESVDTVLNVIDISQSERIDLNLALDVWKENGLSRKEN